MYNISERKKVMLTDTMRSMASVQKISAFLPIENSDFLEVAMMENLGWKVVVKKGEFKIGQKVVYFEIDSAINVKDLLPSMEFLKDRCLKKLFTGRTPETSAFSEEYVRIKTLKLRGQVSQGLILPIEQIVSENFKKTYGETEAVKRNVNRIVEEAKIGEDWTEWLNVEVWDRLLEWYDEHSQLGQRAQMHSAGTFPSDVPKTDETRIESLMKYFNDPEMINAEWECTEKNDGSSCTLFYRPMMWNAETGKPAMQIASRRFLLKDDGGSDDWFAVFKRMGWEELQGLFETLYDVGLGAFSDEESSDGWLLPPHHELAIQGEMIGPKFNGNRDRNKENHFRVFRIFDITDQKFVTPRVRYAICKFLGLEHVKVIDTCKIFQKCRTIDDFETYVDRKSDNGNQIEGVVFKRVDDGDISFKKVSQKYLLKQED